MKKYGLLLVATALISGAALAGYDISTERLPDANYPTRPYTVTIEGAGDVVDSDYIQIFRTLTGESEIVVASDIVGLGSDEWVLSAPLDAAVGLTAPAEVTTETNVLSATECGKTMTLSATTEFVTTLPAVSLGCEFTFIVGAAPSGASYTILTADNLETIKGVAYDMTGGAVAAGAGTAAADTITLVNGTALAGDRVSLWSDGTSWHGIAFSSSSGAITYTSAQ